MLGALFVKVGGLLMKLMWPADNLDSLTLVSLSIIEVKINNGPPYFHTVRCVSFISASSIRVYHFAVPTLTVRCTLHRCAA